MLIQILSDLHGARPKISQKADLLVYAGDVETSPKRVGEYFQSVREYFDKPIIYVTGNHEFYGQVFPNVVKKYAKVSKELGVVFLDNSSTTIDEILFIGATMWTDYDGQRCVAAALDGMNDFEWIRMPKGKKTRKSIPDDFIKEHLKSRVFIEEQLANNVGKKIVVVTHHMPSFSLISDQYKGSQLNGAFAVNMDDTIAKYSPTLWVFGHTHTFKDVNLGDTRCVCNPVGYRGEYTRYQQEYLVEI